MLITSAKEFFNWTTINDTIMGGSSEASCRAIPSGLCLEGNLIEKNGGFVSCCSPLFSPPLDLSEFNGIEIDVEGQGQTLKFAISSGDKFTRVSEFFSGGVKWVAELNTNKIGVSSIKMPFDTFLPNIRAKSIPFPLKISSASIIQFQLLYSKFSTSGRLNPGFKEGPFRIILHSIRGYI